MTKDQQAKYIFSYIHLNPVKLIDSFLKEKKLKNTKKILDFLKNYRLSSYQDYVDIKRPENKILSKKDFPDYFSSKKVFNKEIFDWLNMGSPR